MDFTILNDRVYGLEESMVASTYPMAVKTEDWTFDVVEATHKEYIIARKLAKAKSGSAHDCFLKGVVVQADITAPQYWWLQFGRYHFADIVSSQSKMHRLTKMDIDTQCNGYVHKDMINILKIMIADYNNEPTKEKFQQITASTPMGLMLTARVTMNYLQIKSMYFQRKSHKLEEWKVFCTWAESLPYFKDLVLNV